MASLSANLFCGVCVHSSCQEITAQQGRQERILLPRALLSRQGSFANASAASHQQNTTDFFLVQNLHNDRIIRYNYRNSEVGECEQRRLTKKTVRYDRVQPLIYYQFNCYNVSLITCRLLTFSNQFMECVLYTTKRQYI